jgi:hypothetical protein
MLDCLKAYVRDQRQVKAAKIMRGEQVEDTSWRKLTQDQKRQRHEDERHADDIRSRLWVEVGEAVEKCLREEAARGDRLTKQECNRVLTIFQAMFPLASAAK